MAKVVFNTETITLHNCFSDAVEFSHAIDVVLSPFSTSTVSYRNVGYFIVSRALKEN